MPEIINPIDARNIPDTLPPPCHCRPRLTMQSSASPPIFTPAPKLDLKPTPPMIDTTSGPTTDPNPTPRLGDIVLPKPAPRSHAQLRAGSRPPEERSRALAVE